MHKVGIVGFRGYSGAELVQIAKRHPYIEPVLLEHRSDSSERPEPRGRRQPERRPLADVAMACEGLSAVMLATPHDVSMTLAPAMLEAGVKVVDLSGAFRLTSAEEYTRWYKEPHKAAALLGE